jgi:hypothetical protein
MHSETTAMTLAFVSVLGDCKENDNWRLHAKFSQCHAWGSWQDPEQTVYQSGTDSLINVNL